MGPVSMVSSTLRGRYHFKISRGSHHLENSLDVSSPFACQCSNVPRQDQNHPLESVLSYAVLSYIRTQPSLTREKTIGKMKVVVTLIAVFSGALLAEGFAPKSNHFVRLCHVENNYRTRWTFVQQLTLALHDHSFRPKPGHCWQALTAPILC
jgi:hypothetical protein